MTESASSDLRARFQDEINKAVRRLQGEEPEPIDRATQTESSPVHKYDEYYMKIAIAVRSRAKCTGSKVGAVLVLDDRVIATGFNGTPSGMTNCTDGGCVRCNDMSTYRPGRDYDQCICVHAEANCLLMAAKHGVRVAGATCYTTNQPCFGCLKELRQSGITRIVYMHPLFYGAEWNHMGEELVAMYERLAEGLEILRIQIDGGRVG